MGRRDAYNAGRSKIVPFVPGEHPMDRHDRRKEENNYAAPLAKEWCDRLGIELDIKNHGHHWIFTKGEKRAEWWPSSAKLVIEQKWNHGIHTHDYMQVMRILEERWIRRRS